MMGVDIDKFWTMTPKSLDPYYKAFSLRQKYDDNLLWMNGMYMAMAIGSIISKDSKYPKRPMIAQQELESDTELLAQRRMENIKQTMMERMFVVNRRINGEGG